MSNFWDLVWLVLSTFIFVACLLVMLQIVVDLLRDQDLGGGSKPGVTAIIYIISRGSGMAAGQHASLNRAKSDTDACIRDVAGKSTAAHVAEAKALLDAGTISQFEFAKLKAKALA